MKPFLLALVLVLPLGCGRTGSGDPYAGMSDQAVRQRLGTPTSVSDGHFGLPSADFAAKFKPARTLFYKAGGNDIYITVFDDHGTWRECASATVPHGTQF